MKFTPILTATALLTIGVSSLHNSTNFLIDNMSHQLFEYDD